MRVQWAHRTAPSGPAWQHERLSQRATVCAETTGSQTSGRRQARSWQRPWRRRSQLIGTVWQHDDTCLNRVGRSFVCWGVGANAGRYYGAIAVVAVVSLGLVSCCGWCS